MHLYAPSETTRVKNFYVIGNSVGATNRIQEIYVAGFITLTTYTVINALKFYFSSGNISGKITLYGVS